MYLWLTFCQEMLTLCIYKKKHNYDKRGTSWHTFKWICNIFLITISTSQKTTQEVMEQKYYLALGCGTRHFFAYLKCGTKWIYRTSFRLNCKQVTYHLRIIAIRYFFSPFSFCCQQLLSLFIYTFAYISCKSFFVLIFSSTHFMYSQQALLIAFHFFCTLCSTDLWICAFFPFFSFFFLHIYHHSDFWAPQGLGGGRWNAARVGNTDRWDADKILIWYCSVATCLRNTLTRGILVQRLHYASGTTV